MRHDHFNFKTVVRCQNPKNEANGRRITDFKQIWQISASRTIALLHTYSPKWLFHCTKHSRGQTSKPGNCTGACVHKATRADTQRRPHRSIVGVKVFSANSTSPRLWLSTNHRYAGMHHSTYAGALLVYSWPNVAEAIAFRFLVNSHSTITFSSTACLQS